jgi:hypothetical protein
MLKPGGERGCTEDNGKRHRGSQEAAIGRGCLRIVSLTKAVEVNKISVQIWCERDPHGDGDSSRHAKWSRICPVGASF